MLNIKKMMNPLVITVLAILPFLSACSEVHKIDEEKTAKAAKKIEDKKRCDFISEQDSFYGLNPEDSECVAKLVAEAMIENLPIKADKYTTLTSVIAEKSILLYKYKVIVPEHLDKYKLEVVMNEDILNSNCTEPEVRNVIDLGVEFQHTYQDEKGIHLFKVLVDKNKCESLKI